MTRHLLAAAVYAATMSPLLAADAPVDVGNLKQLFVDDYVIERMEGVERELGTVVKANEGKPVFTDGWFYGTVLHDEGKFKMWFRESDGSGYGYAESTDGVHFVRRAKLMGINFAGDVNLCVTLDSHEADRDHRFKAGYDAPGMAMGIAHSADGINWKPYNGGKPVTYRAADTYNQIIWDDIAGVYRLFTRTDFGSGGGPLSGTAACDFEVRGTRSMTNPDVKANPSAWKLVRHWQFDREGPKEYLRRQIYSVTVWTYEGVYFAFLLVYEYPGDVSEGKATDHVKRHERDVLQFYVATSRDANEWDLTWVYAGLPIVPRGPDGAFDKDMLMPSSTVVTHDDKHWIYYGGANERHGTSETTPPVSFESQRGIGLATLRLDGFVCLSAEAEGTALTKPFALKGSGLEINVDSSRGEVSVEILDAAGNPIAGFCGDDAAACRGVDDLRLGVSWRNGRRLSELKGKTVRLRFRLRNARLYSFRIRP